MHSPDNFPKMYDSGVDFVWFLTDGSELSKIIEGELKKRNVDYISIPADGYSIGLPIVQVESKSQRQYQIFRFFNF